MQSRECEPRSNPSDEQEPKAHKAVICTEIQHIYSIPRENQALNEPLIMTGLSKKERSELAAAESTSGKKPTEPMESKSNKKREENGFAAEEAVAAAAAVESSKQGPVKTNINQYFGHKIGFLHMLSLALNAGLMVYAHVGLSAVIFSSQDPASTTLPTVPGDNNTATGQCSAADLTNYLALGGSDAQSEQSNFCSREYNGGCLIDTGCIEECFQTQYGYSADCSTCFSAIPICGFQQGCVADCLTDPSGDACRICNIPCQEQFVTCSGLPGSAVANTPNANVEQDPTMQTNGADSSNNMPAFKDLPQQCNVFDYEAVDRWYVAYPLSFVESIEDAWNGDAKGLAIVIVIFSGIWPYLKNVMLAVLWYLPCSRKVQTKTLLWLSRLSKYTLVDVFAVICILVAIQLQLDFGGVEAIVRAEARFSIIAFFLATLWEFLEIEVIKHQYESKVLGVGHSNSSTDNQGDVEEAREAKNTEKEHFDEPLPVKRIWIPIVLVVLSIGLYISGAVLDLVTFKSADTASVCVKNYNLVTLGNALIGYEGLAANMTPGQSWFLYLCWVFLLLILPITTHVLQLIVLANRTIAKGFLGPKEKFVRTWTSNIWCFATIEVLMISVFSIEFRFPDFISRIAGDGAALLRIDSDLNAGFAILVVYSVVAGFAQYTLRVCPPGIGYRKDEP